MNNLVQRLRGIYEIPVNDGAGLLDGKATFTRTFEVPPIQVEAADEIERLKKQLKESEQIISDVWGEIEKTGLISNGHGNPAPAVADIIATYQKALNKITLESHNTYTTKLKGLCN